MKSSITFIITFLFLLSVKAQIPSKEITWEEVYQTAGGECFAINSGGDIFAGTGGSQVLRSTNGGDDWEQCLLPNYTGEINSIAVNTSDNIFLTTGSGFYDGSFYRSTDNGDTWVQLHADSGDYFYCLDINSADVIFFGTSKGVVRSFDNGDNLEQTGWNNYVENLTVSPVDDDIFILSGGFVQRSTDDGQNWTNVSTGLTNTGINSFAFNSFDHIFAGTAAPEGGVFVSTNNGDNWIVTGYSFLSTTDSVVTTIFISAVNDIFIGTFGLGALYSTDDGSSWTEINNGLPTGILIDAFIVNANGHLIAGSSVGIFRTLEPVVVSIDDFAFNLPNSFLLAQNFPNPFNPITKINYSVPQSSNVTIKVFDLLGNEIETLVNEEKPAGTYGLIWNAVNLPSGVYFYQLKAGAYIDTKNMVLMK